METKAGHLTYCTNIHPGEDWNTHFDEIRTHLPVIKSHISPDTKMGIGLRLSNRMSKDLVTGNALDGFRTWLAENQFYVFTMNGFPFGQFHEMRIKDQVHAPDWTTGERLDYTLRLFDILMKILPEGIESGGVSTSPLSYRFWHKTKYDFDHTIETATGQIVRVASYLHDLYELYGINMHLDIEPEPDGMIENGDEFIHWYNEMLLPAAYKAFSAKGVSRDTSDRITRRHIQLCYDVCHMAVEFEDQKNLTDQLKRHNIPIGKIQLSSALRLLVDGDPEELNQFDEDQYLHQVVVKRPNGVLTKYKDLSLALKSQQPTPGEWRVHFHVPLFTESYGNLVSTRDYIDEIISIHELSSLTGHFEIETYTWDVLPTELRLPIDESITREIQYILELIR